MGALPTAAEAVVGPHAQFGEDRILEGIFRDCARGYCAEVGAYDGLTGSTTLASGRKGRSCLLVEPNPDLLEQIRRNRGCAVDGRAASAREGDETFYVADHVEQMSTLELDHRHHRWVREVGGELRATTVRTAPLDTMLEDAGLSQLDFVTIDVEGHELDVLQGLTLERFRPRVVIIEENVPHRRTDVAKHMASHRYVNFRRTGVNEWYAREDDTDLIDPAAVTRFRRERQVLRARDAAMRLLAKYTPAVIKRTLYGIRKLLRRSG
jgi:FkbM family methyltransferase